jgi:hypothetical protein
VVGVHDDRVRRVEVPEVFAHSPGGDFVAAGEPLDGAFGEVAAGVRLVGDGEAESEQAGGAGGVDVAAVDEKARVDRPGVVAEDGGGSFGEGVFSR